MSPTLLQYLACPSCRGRFEVRYPTYAGAELISGTLVCVGCEAMVPVWGGIPRFVQEDTYASSFAREWKWFRTVQLDSMNGTRESERRFEETTGWTEDDLRGKLVLDAGVGAGRYAEIAARKGAEVIGVDLSRAVEAARENLGANERVHLVQADIFALPFRPETFDRAYSIGVLHHTPDPHAAFCRVANTVKRDGELAVYLYHFDGVSHRGSDLLRKVTTHLPDEVMLALSALAVPARPVYRLPFIGKALQLVCPISPEPSWKQRWLDTFDWYTPAYQWKLRHPEVLRWFRECGFADTRVADEPIRVTGRRRLRPSEARAA